MGTRYLWPRHSGWCSHPFRSLIPETVEFELREYVAQAQTTVESRRVSERGSTLWEVVIGALGDQECGLKYPRLFAPYSDARGNALLSPRVTTGCWSSSTTFARMFAVFVGFGYLYDPERPLSAYFSDLNQSIGEMCEGMCEALDLHSSTAHGVELVDEWVQMHLGRMLVHLTFVNDWPSHPDVELCSRMTPPPNRIHAPPHAPLYAFVAEIVWNRWKLMLTTMAIETMDDFNRSCRFFLLNQMKFGEVFKMVMDTVMYQHAILASESRRPVSTTCIIASEFVIS